MRAAPPDPTGDRQRRDGLASVSSAHRMCPVRKTETGCPSEAVVGVGEVAPREIGGGGLARHMGGVRARRGNGRGRGGRRGGGVGRGGEGEMSSRSCQP